MLSRLSEHPYFKHTMASAEALRAWVQDNPELAEAWEEALQEDEFRRLSARDARRAEMAQEALPEALTSCGVPLRCVEVLAGLQETPALKAVKAWWRGESTFCLLLGAAGAGKSVAASWAIQDQVYPDVLRWIERPHGRRLSARFMRAGDMARMSAYGHEAEREFEAMCSVQLFALDDMGTERPSDTWLALLDELIDRRYGDKLKTVLTTNLDAEAFKKRYGERIADRIRHDGLVAGAGTTSLRARL